jgi:hypothetical protein
MQLSHLFLVILVSYFISAQPFSCDTCQQGPGNCCGNRGIGWTDNEDCGTCPNSSCPGLSGLDPCDLEHDACNFDSNKCNATPVLPNCNIAKCLQTVTSKPGKNLKIYLYVHTENSNFILYDRSSMFD